MDDIGRDLRSYYEAEARARTRTVLSERRVAVVDEFLSLMQAERRRSVVEFGAGPGLDGARFVDAGHRYVGVDLAHGNALLAAERNVTVVQADIAALPFAPGAFDAGWSMSTLMHVPEADVSATVSELVRLLRPGAPLFVGLWGGDQGQIVSEQGVEGQRRMFSLRSPGRNRELLAASAPIEWSTTWDLGPDHWSYQLFRLRVGATAEDSSRSVSLRR